MISKPESETIKILEQLAEHETFHTSIFFTYGADLAFFEEAILNALWRKGCRNNLIFMDASRYIDTMEDWAAAITWVGRRYIVIPVDLGILQSFHPKLILLLGHERGRLLLGSGNLTFSGYGHNHEIFTCLDWTADEQRFRLLFTQAWEMVQIVLKRWSYSDEAQEMLRKTAYICDWLGFPEQQPAAIQLLHTLDHSLLEQCRAALADETIKEITIVSPFLDQSAQALKMLYAEFKPQRIRLVLQDGSVVGNLAALEKLQQEGMPLDVYRFNDDVRYLHAKVYIFDTQNGAYVFTGSANCTRAALLSTSANGNVEAGLLIKGTDSARFHTLISPFISSQPVHEYREITFRKASPVTPGRSNPIRLLDIVSERGQLAVKYRLDLPLEKVAELQLRFSTTPAYLMSFGKPGTGAVTLHQPIPETLAGLLNRPLSARLCGISTGNENLDYLSNEVWITNADVLHREISSALPTDVRTGRILFKMALEDEEWGDLYESLTRLIELDVAGLKHRGGTYTATPRPKPVPGTTTETEEKETTVVLVDEYEEKDGEALATTLYRESPLYAWFQYVLGRLPGSAITPEEKKPGDKPDTPPHRRKPSRKPIPAQMKDRFVGLVKKYIGSLMNAEYMETISPPHTLVYYTVFQRITWLLLHHGAITRKEFCDLVDAMNAGFFGIGDGEPPILAQHPRRQIQRKWKNDWHDTNIPTCALTGLIQSVAWRPDRYDTTDQDHWLMRTQDRLLMQDLHVLCCIATVVGFEPLTQKVWTSAADVKTLSGEDSSTFKACFTVYIRPKLTLASGILDTWIRKTSIALAEDNSPQHRQRMLEARTDYGLARMDILKCLGDSEARTNLCSNLILWMRQAGDEQSSILWRKKLMEMLQELGKDREAAREMFRQGKDLFFSRQYEEAALILRQAEVLAESLGDKALIAKAQQALRNAEIFLQLPDLG